MRAVPNGKSGAQSISVGFKYEYVDGDKRTSASAGGAPVHSWATVGRGPGDNGALPRWNGAAGLRLVDGAVRPAAPVGGGGAVRSRQRSPSWQKPAPPSPSP